jgi:hypothetical protein
MTNVVNEAIERAHLTGMDREIMHRTLMSRASPDSVRF